MPQITLMAANSAKPRRLNGPLLADIYQFILVWPTGYSGPLADGYARKRPPRLLNDQPEHCLRSIWTEARRAHGWDGLGGRWSLGLAIAAGLALAGAFPPVGIWPLAIAGPALLTLAVWRKRTLPAFGLGLACGAVFFVGLLSWLVNVAWYAWAALAGLEALIFAVTVIALPPLLRLRGWPLAVAGWWVAQEAIRDRVPWGGFPWGRLAMSQASAPTAGWSAIGGPPVLTLLAALAGTGIAYLVVTAMTGAARASGQVDRGRK